MQVFRYLSFLLFSNWIVHFSSFGKDPQNCKKVEVTVNERRESLTCRLSDARSVVYV